MSKFIFFVVCAVFLIAGAQSQEVPDAVKNIHDKVEAAIIAISNQIQYILDGAKEKANEVGLQIKNSAVKIAQDMHEQVKKYLAETQKRVDEIVENAGYDASDCKVISESLEKAALETMANMSVCVTDKVEQGNGYIESMVKITEDLKAEIDGIKQEANNCLLNIEGFISAAKAIACVNGAGAKATWVSAKSVPSYTKKIIQFSYLMGSLPIKLPYCTAYNGFVGFVHKSNQVIDDVKKCIQSKKPQ